MHKCGRLPDPGRTSKMRRQRYANATLSCKRKLGRDLANLLDTIPRGSMAFSGLALTRGLLVKTSLAVFAQASSLQSGGRGLPGLQPQPHHSPAHMGLVCSWPGW